LAGGACRFGAGDGVNLGIGWDSGGLARPLPDYWHIETVPPVMFVAVQPLAPKSSHQS
jgi:hypothetical protein